MNLYYDRRRLPAPHPAVVVVSRRARRRKARFLGRNCAAAVPVGYDYRGTPHESGLAEEIRVNACQTNARTPASVDALDAVIRATAKRLEDVSDPGDEELTYLPMGGWS